MKECATCKHVRISGMTLPATLSCVCGKPCVDCSEYESRHNMHITTMSVDITPSIAATFVETFREELHARIDAALDEVGEKMAEKFGKDQ